MCSLTLWSICEYRVCNHESQRDVHKQTKAGGSNAHSDSPHNTRDNSARRPATRETRERDAPPTRNATRNLYVYVYVWSVQCGAVGGGRDESRETTYFTLYLFISEHPRAPRRSAEPPGPAQGAGAHATRAGRAAPPPRPPRGRPGKRPRRRNPDEAGLALSRYSIAVGFIALYLTDTQHSNFESDPSVLRPMCTPPTHTASCLVDLCACVRPPNMPNHSAITLTLTTGRSANCSALTRWISTACGGLGWAVLSLR